MVNLRTVGLPSTISTNVTEGRMKTVTAAAVKTKAKKNNNQASFGGSILKNNMEVEAAIELAHDLDATGMHSVCFKVALCWIARFLSGLLKRVGDFMQTLHSREKVCM